jgi:uncharacterized protein (TIGR03382 family)
MPSPMAVAFPGWTGSYHVTRSTVEIAGAGALVFALLVVWVVVRRRRDPIGRSLAAYSMALAALRDSAARATTARPSTSQPTASHDPPQPAGVTIVTSSVPDG